jgi:hypothetical protein
MARFIQLHQSKPGEATVYLTCDARKHSAEDAARDFDTSGTAIRFSFILKDRPYRTGSGKIPLLLPPAALS